MTGEASAPEAATKPLRSKGGIRLRAVGAAFVVAIVEAIPGAPEVALFAGIDPLSYAKRQMLQEMGVCPDHNVVYSAKASRRVTKQVARGAVSVVAKALKGTRYVGSVAKRANVMVAVVVSMASGISAYREMTTLGFAALDGA